MWEMKVWNDAGKYGDAKPVFGSCAVPVVEGQPLWSKSEGLETFVVTLIWDSVRAGVVFFSVSVSWHSSVFCMQQEKSKPREVHIL